MQAGDLIKIIQNTKKSIINEIDFFTQNQVRIPNQTFQL